MTILLGYLYLCLVWGVSWVAIKFSNTSFPPLFGAALRFYLSGAILLLWAWRRGHLQRITWRDLRLLVGTGFLTFNIGYGLVYLGEVHVESSLTAAIFGTFPLFVALLTHFMKRDEPLGGWGIVGVVVGFGGVIVLLHPSGVAFAPEHRLWIALLLLSPLACALNVVWIKRDGAHLNPYTLNILPLFMGAAGLHLLSLLREKELHVALSIPGVSALLFLTLFVTVIAFTLYYLLLKRMPLVLLSSTAYVSLLFAVLSGWLFLGESLTFGQGAGMALILTGVWAVQHDQASTGTK